MPTTVIEAQMRMPGGKNANRRLRKSGIIPAVLYGPDQKPMAISVDPHLIQTVLHSETGRNTIFTLAVEGSKQDNAMVKDYQLDPVRGDLIHVDFIQIAMDRQLELSVNIEIVGEPEGVKIEGGIMDFVTRSVEVACLPADIPESIKVDVSHLKINDYIRVKNLEADSRVKILSDPDVVVVTVIPPVKEEVRVEEAAEAASEPEVIKKGKAAEEGEEGGEKES
ncbi:MAG: 50S ribosomal protein L25 [Acidobacteria bacterium]|nr:50S ribosomal protein L25 [Acidobacteriota bacterium]